MDCRPNRDHFLNRLDVHFRLAASRHAEQQDCLMAPSMNHLANRGQRPVLVLRQARSRFAGHGRPAASWVKTRRRSAANSLRRTRDLTGADVQPTTAEISFAEAGRWTFRQVGHARLAVACDSRSDPSTPRAGRKTAALACPPDCEHRPARRTPGPLPSHTDSSPRSNEPTPGLPRKSKTARPGHAAPVSAGGSFPAGPRNSTQ